MGLTTHLKARAALLFLGFFAGAIVNMNLPLAVTTGPLQDLLFFGLPFGGAYVLQFAFARLRPAACPRCGGAAWPHPKNVALYICRDCATASNGLESLMRGPDSPKDGP